jgi:putative transposase
MMKTSLPDTWPQFFTATVAAWRPLFEQNKYKDIIVESLQYLVKNNKIILYGFVIMKNHIHLIWQGINPAGDNTRPGQPGYPLQKVQESFMKFTAQQIKFDLVKHHPDILALYKVNAYDREYNFWKRRSLGIELFSPAVFHQKLDYIHYNPVKAVLCALPTEYYYSSANFYFTGIDAFNMLTHYDGN